MDRLWRSPPEDGFFFHPAGFSFLFLLELGFICLFFLSCVELFLRRSPTHPVSAISQGQTTLRLLFPDSQQIIFPPPDFWLWALYIRFANLGACSKKSASFFL